EGVVAHDEAEQRARADPARIPAETAEQPGQRAADEREVPVAEPHASGEPGQAAEASEYKERSENDRQHRALHDRLQRGPDEAADRARDTETKQHSPIDVRADQDESHERPRDMGERHDRDGEADVESK